MAWFTEAIGIIGLFILRLGVPLAITLAVAYWLRTLDAKWQADAEIQRHAILAKPEPAAEPNIKMLKVLEEPCWVRQGCAEAKRMSCPAYLRPDLPCWMARCWKDGRLPTTCANCVLFDPEQVPQELIR